MFDTAFTLSLTHFARSLSFPERMQRRAARNGLLEAWRMRSTGLDALYYDIKSLSPDEVYYISDAIAAEGLIMIVPPSGGEMLTICDNVEEYVLRGGRKVHTLTVAGIGGSAIGAAAFARNVADAVGEPVAAVVSGYGLGDIMHEAMGGSLFFGWLGNLRNECEVIDDVVGRPHFGAYDTRHALPQKTDHTCLDIDTVESLLADPRLEFSLLTGHSKGNIVLSQALHALKAESPERLADMAAKTRIVTFGSAIAMPADFLKVTDVMGDLDWYGQMNSQPTSPHQTQRLPFAGHSTNTDLPACLRVTDILREIAAQEQIKPETIEAPPMAKTAPPAPTSAGAAPRRAAARSTKQKARR